MNGGVPMKYETGRIIFTLIFLIPAVLLTIMNASIFYKGYIKKEKTPSPAYFLGGVLYTLAIIVFFGNDSHWYYFLFPFVLDGTVPAVMRALICEFADHGKDTGRSGEER